VRPHNGLLQIPRQRRDRRELLENLAQGQLHPESLLDAPQGLHQGERVRPQLQERGLDVEIAGLDAEHPAEDALERRGDLLRRRLGRHRWKASWI